MTTFVNTLQGETPFIVEEIFVSETLPFRYLAISDRCVCPEPIPDRINRLQHLGVGGIQLRDKTETDATRYEWITSVSDGFSKILVNGRADLAELARIDGVHLPERGLNSEIVEKIMSSDNPLIGRSVHTVPKLKSLSATDVDYALFGPIFPTPSKPTLDKKDCHGVEGLREATKNSPVPVLAVGGILPSAVSECLRAGAHGVAGIRALFEPEDPSSNWDQIQSDLTYEQNRTLRS